MKVDKANQTSTTFIFELLFNIPDKDEEVILGYMQFRLKKQPLSKLHNSH